MVRVLELESERKMLQSSSTIGAEVPSCATCHHDDVRDWKLSCSSWCGPPATGQMAKWSHVPIMDPCEIDRVTHTHTSCRRWCLTASCNSSSLGGEDDGKLLLRDKHFQGFRCSRIAITGGGHTTGIREVVNKLCNANASLFHSFLGPVMKPRDICSAIWRWIERYYCEISLYFNQGTLL